MLTSLIIRLLAPVILEIVKELLGKLADGKQVQLDELSVKTLLMARQGEIDRHMKTAMTGVGISYEEQGGL